MILDTVRKTIRDYSLFEKGQRVVVGVSGGPDSVALLLTLCSLSKELGLVLAVAHLDHGLRSASAKERIYVERLAGKMGLPYFGKSVRVRPSGRVTSIEEAARLSRFDFFRHVCKRFRASKVALGHNRDDQAETVLMRLLRGSGLSGLSAIAPLRRFGSLVVARPMIEVSRRDIESFLRRRKVRFMVDETNFSDAYFRNRIRHRLIPLLEKEYNANIRKVLAQNAASIADDYDYILLSASRSVRGIRSSLGLTSLRRMHPSIRRMALRLLFSRVKGNTRMLTGQHIAQIMDMIEHRPVNSVVDLPGSISVKKSRSAISFFRRS